jgi:predicted nucleotidyltransferase
MERATSMDIPIRFREAYNAIRNLEQYDRYAGALIFGSVARRSHTADSDLDVKVVVDDDNPCNNINHPIIHSVKLDITFHSLRQLEEPLDKEIAKGERAPMIAGSLIVFDKAGELQRIVRKANQAKPKPFTHADRQLTQFMMYHADDKAKRHLSTDPLSALLVMHTSFSEILKMHYQIQGKWWVSNKWLLSDLRTWDMPLVLLVEQFVSQCNVQEKFKRWSEIIDYVLKPIGGRQPISENNCDCATCREDLGSFLDAILRRAD